MTQRDAVFPTGQHDLYKLHSYSAAIRSGDLLFVSGQVGSRSDGSPEPDFEAQVVWHSPILRRPCKRVDADLTISST
jgi:enamine deaminase RidA (YjgF/YER057c/UK114 family)